VKDVFGIVGTTQAGSFRVESVVAEGGFAVVYRAQHGAFRAPVALKCLKVPDEMTAEHRHQFLDKFREEGELLFRLSAHIPAVVRPLHVDVLDVASDRFVPFLALEWLDGDGLDVIIRRRHEQGKPPLTLEKLVPFLTPVAQALACAHRFPGPDGVVSIIHRDLKPENIFVARSQGGELVKILDYGIARTRSAATLYAGRITKSGAFDAFTPGYAAPEQWLPKRYGQTGPWTDVWGLALTMVEALTGKPPIVGDVAAMMGTTVDETLRPTPRAEGVDVSDEIEAIFDRALSVDPRLRTQSIEELWTDLELALGLEPSLAPSDSRVGSGRAVRINTIPPGGTSPAPSRRSPAASSVLVRDLGTIEDDPLEFSPPTAESFQPTPPKLSRGASSASLPAQRISSSSLPAQRISSPSLPSQRSTPPSGPTSTRGATPSSPAAARTSSPSAPSPSRRSPTPPSRGLTPGADPVRKREAPLDAYANEHPSPAFVADSVPPRMPLELAYEPPRPPPSELWPQSDQSGASVRARLKLPLSLVSFAIALGVAENLYFRQMGANLSVGPVRALWIAAPVALIGVILGGVRLFARQD
jgi:serine/threonine-protein kinase